MIQAGVAVDVFWALTDLERSQPAGLRGRCDFLDLFFFYISPTTYVSFQVFSLLPQKGDFLMRLICVSTSVTVCCSCLACVAYACRANCEVL